jgi:hypothetical protein
MNCLINGVPCLLSVDDDVGDGCLWLPDLLTSVELSGANVETKGNNVRYFFSSLTDASGKNKFFHCFVNSDTMQIILKRQDSIPDTEL